MKPETVNKWVMRSGYVLMGALFFFMLFAVIYIFTLIALQQTGIAAKMIVAVITCLIVAFYGSRLLNAYVRTMDLIKKQDEKK